MTSTNTTCPSPTSRSMAARSKPCQNAVAGRGGGGAASVAGTDEGEQQRRRRREAARRRPARSSAQRRRRHRQQRRHRQRRARRRLRPPAPRPATPRCGERQAQHAAQHQHPSPGPRQRLRQPRQQRHQQEGRGKPMPRARKMAKISIGPAASAKPMAVPRNGAEQGVASSVAKAPAAILPKIAPFSLWRAARPPTQDGSGTSKKPQRLQAKSVSSTAMKTRNSGCWNCTPQPTAMPADLSATIAAARIRKDRIIPAAEARKPRRTAVRERPPCSITPSSLIDSTGSTQGMKLRMKPAEQRQPAGSPAAGRDPPAAAPPAASRCLQRPLAIDQGDGERLARPSRRAPPACPPPAGAAAPARACRWRRGAARRSSSPAAPR